MASLKFRVLIDTADSEEIFRDILIADDDNFESLYHAIVEAFNFSGDQLASFYLSNDNWDRGHEITLMDMGFGENSEPPSIMNETIIRDLMESKNQKMILVYDFMRMWCFLIELVETSPESVGAPEVILSVGEAPDEESKEMDLSADMGMPDMDLGNDFDDIFSNGDDDEEDMDFENLDDYDI